MQIILKGNNEEYAVRDIVRLFLPGCNMEFCEKIHNSDEYIIVSVKKNDEGYEYYSEFLNEGNIHTHSFIKPDYSKNHIKRVLYELLSDVLNITPPWGILTGIRPSKKVIELWNEGHTKPESARILKEDFLTSHKKTILAIETASYEKDVIDKMDKNSVSLYIGIPFCPTRCSYCSFISQSIKFSSKLIKPYLDALKTEFHHTAELVKKLGYNIETVYIGGGTPTSLDEENLYTLLDNLNSTFDLSNIKEFTVEAGRPDTITRDKLRIIKESGAERISINPQTMNDKTLRIIGRCHTAEDIREKFHMAREEGFRHINTDLIAGLPGEDEKDFGYTLSEIEKLNPDSVTIHSLSLKKGAYLDRQYNCLSTQASNIANNMIDMACDKMYSMGKRPYYMYRQKNTAGNLENIGFCDPYKESLYNIYIMQEIQTIIAMGSGGSTKRVMGDRIERCFNVKEVSEYINRIDEMVDRKYKLFEI